MATNVTRRRSRGQALVEFSIAFLVFVFVVFGIIDLGRVVYAHNALSEAAREGARYGSVQARSATDIPGIEAFTVDHVTAIPDVTATAQCIRTGAVVLACHQYDTLEVRAEADVEMLTPLLSQLMGGLGLNPISLSSTSQVLVNN
jgi:Flp pilus assembly protein TadG